MQKQLCFKNNVRKNKMILLAQLQVKKMHSIAVNGTFYFLGKPKV